MAQPAFNGTTHHVGLGPSGSQIGLMLGGSYNKAPQRDGGVTEQGGDTDLVLPSHSRWTQDDFTGGMFQEIWGRDSMMFKYCSGFRPLPYSRALGTLPPVIQAIVASADVPVYGIGGQSYRTYQPATIFQTGGMLHVVFPGGDALLCYDLMNETVTSHALPNVTMGEGNVAAYHREEKILYISSDVDQCLYRFTLAADGTPSAATVASYSYPTAVGTRDLLGMNADGPRITCFFGKMIADLTVPDNASSAVGAGSKQWAVNRRYHLPSQYKDSIFFNSQLYILTSDNVEPLNPHIGGTGGWRSQIVAWDGADLFPVVDFPYTFRARCMTEYAGRVYVGGAGQDLGGTDDAFGELFEITGSSVRSVRGFSREALSTLAGVENGPSSINDLAVYEGLLWYHNENEDRLDFYDVTTDAFFGGPSYADGDDIVRLVPLGETLGVYTQPYGFVDPVPPGNLQDGTLSWIAKPGDTSGTYTPEIITSDFSFEPAKDKCFSEMAVMTRGQDTYRLYYSVDGGETYTQATELSSEDEGNYWVTTFDLSTMPAAKRATFKIQLQLTTSTGFAELVAFSTSFNVLHSGKKAWMFTVLGAEKIEGYDGTRFSQDTADIEDSLFSWMVAGTKLVYTDLTGDNYNVRVHDVQENQLQIGPKVAFADGTRPEAHFTVALIEV